MYHYYLQFLNLGEIGESKKRALREGAQQRSRSLGENGRQDNRVGDCLGYDGDRAPRDFCVSKP